MTTQSFREISERMMAGEDMDDIISTAEKTEEQTPKDTESAPADEENKETQKVESVEEVEPFAEKGDLVGKTPEELEEIYAKWNKSYTQKRQQETAQMKQAREDYEARIAALEAKLNTPVEEKTPVSPEAEMQTAEGQDRYNQVLTAFKEGRINEQQLALYIKAIQADEVTALVEEKVTEQAKIQQETQYQERAIEAFKNADPRLNEDSPDFQPRMQRAIGSEMGELLDVYMEQHGTSIGFDYQGELGRLIQEYDKDLDAIVKARVAQSTRMAKARAAKAEKTQINGSNTNVSSGQPKGLRDILDEAVQ